MLINYGRQRGQTTAVDNVAQAASGVLDAMGRYDGAGINAHAAECAGQSDGFPGFIVVRVFIYPGEGI